MKLAPILTATCLLAVGTAAADDAHHPEAATKPPAAAPAAKGTDGMHEHMKLMREQMTQIRAATDPKEKERLMEQHMKSMEESMATMQRMMKHDMM